MEEILTQSQEEVEQEGQPLRLKARRMFKAPRKDSMRGNLPGEEPIFGPRLSFPPADRVSAPELVEVTSLDSLPCAVAFVRAKIRRGASRWLMTG